MDKISKSEMPVDEKRKELGKINRQLLRLVYLDVTPEKLQEEKSKAETILDNTLASKLNSEVGIIMDFADSLRSQVEGILSDIPVVPVVPTVGPNLPSGTSPTLGVRVPVAQPMPQAPSAPSRTTP